MTRSFVSHGVRQCGEIGTIVIRKKSYEEGRTHVTRARVEMLRLEELRGEEIARREQEIA